jgi:hypothetical protein
MNISAMKCALQSLEAVERTNGWNRKSITGKHCSQSIHFLRQAIGQADVLDELVAENKRLGLYETPKKEWVSLTVEEIKELHNQWESGNLWEGWNYERALEAKLKEKNSG